jgi:hypothetical protein
LQGFKLYFFIFHRVIIYCQSAKFFGSKIVKVVGVIWPLFKNMPMMQKLRPRLELMIDANEVQEVIP